MEKSTFKELYYGNIAPGEQTFARDSAYGEAVRTAAKLGTHLISVIGEESKKDFNALLAAQTEMLSIAGSEAFVDGCRLGARIMLEVLSDGNGDLQQIS